MTVARDCVRCHHGKDEHPDPEPTPAEALAWPDSGPCHRYEPPAPLLLVAANRVLGRKRR